MTENKPGLLNKIPTLISSKVSIFIYLFLFFYLIVFAIICLMIPVLNDWAPSGDAQMILGNYTNILSALGASIAAGSGVSIHSKIKSLHQNHLKLQDSMDALHKKMDKLNSK